MLIPGFQGAIRQESLTPFGWDASSSQVIPQRKLGPNSAWWTETKVPSISVQTQHQVTIAGFKPATIRLLVERPLKTNEPCSYKRWFANDKV